MLRLLAGLAVIAAIVVLVFSAALPAGLALAAIVLLGLMFIGRAAATRQIVGHTPADWPLLALLALLPVGLWASADLAVTLPRAYAFIAAAALYWTVAAQGGRPWLLRYTGWALLLAGFAMALAVIAATPLAGSAILSPLAQAIRAPLPFLQPERFNPNLSGQLLAILLAPAAAYALIGERAAPGGRLLRLAAAVLSLLLAALLLLTQSRGALLGLAVALPVMTTLANRRWLWVWGPLGLAGSVAIVILQPSLSATLLAGGDALSSAQGRVELWSRALYLMQDFPFTGVGLGMPERVINLLYPLFMVGPDSQWMHVHNTYLQIGSEMGIPGLIAFLALLLAVGAALLQTALHGRDDEDLPTTALGLVGALLVFVVHGLVDAPLASPKLMVLFFGLLGLMAAVVAPGEAQPAKEL